MPSGFNIEANVSLNSASLNASAKEVKHALGRITGQASEFQKSLDASTARVFAFGATTAVLNGVTQSFKKLISVTIEVEKKLVEINSIFQATDATFNKFRNSIFQVAKETGQAFGTVADGAAELARQGLSAEETAKRLKAALILTRISGLEAEKSVKALTAAINGFTSAGLTANQIVNKMVAVDIAFAVSAQDLAEAFSRAGSTAEDAGVSFNELLGLVTAVEQRTARGGAVIGNAFKSIFTRLARGGTIDQLKALGVEIDATQTGIQKLKALSVALDNISDPTKASAIKELAGGVFQINVVSAALKDLGSDTSIFANAAKTASQATNEAFEKNAALNKTISAQINTLVVGLTSLAEKIGSVTFGPLMENLIGLASTFTEFLDKALDPEKGSVFIKGLFKTIGQFLSGPALVIFTAAFVKIFGLVAKFAKEGLKSIFLIGSETQKIQGIEAGLIGLLQKDENLRAIIASTTATQAQKEQAVIAAIQRENALLTQQAQIMRQLATLAAQRGVTGMAATGGFKGKGGKMFAGGHRPSGFEMEESMATMMGARNPKAKRISAQIDGKQTSAIVNNKERIYRNVGKNGDDAIVPTYAGGYVPNFVSKVQFNLNKGLKDHLGKALPDNWISASKAAHLSKRDKQRIGYKAGKGKQRKKRTGLLTINAGNDFGMLSAFAGDITKSPTTTRINTKTKAGIKQLTDNYSNIAKNRLMQSDGTNPVKQIKLIGLQVSNLEKLKKGFKKKFKKGVTKRFSMPLMDFASDMMGDVFKGNDKKDIQEALMEQDDTRLFSKSVEGGIFEAAMRVGIKKAKSVEEFNKNANDSASWDFEENLGAKSLGKKFNQYAQFSPNVFRADAKRTSSGDAGRSMIAKILQNPASRKHVANQKAMGYTYKAAGYIPNFAKGGLGDAIEREKNAGVPVNKIRAHFAGGTPVAVTNTAHEPNGLRDVMAAGGFIPNFAGGDMGGKILTLSLILPQLVNTFTMAKEREISAAQSVTDNQLQTAEEALETAEAMGEATEAIEKLTARINQLKVEQGKQKTQMEAQQGKTSNIDRAISGSMLALMAAPFLKKFVPAGIMKKFASKGGGAAKAVSAAPKVKPMGAEQMKGHRAKPWSMAQVRAANTANKTGWYTNARGKYVHHKGMIGGGGMGPRKNLNLKGGFKAPKPMVKPRAGFGPKSMMGKGGIAALLALAVRDIANTTGMNPFSKEGMGSGFSERANDKALFYNMVGGKGLSNWVGGFDGGKSGNQYDTTFGWRSKSRQGGGTRTVEGANRDDVMTNIADQMYGKVAKTPLSETRWGRDFDSDTPEKPILMGGEVQNKIGAGQTDMIYGTNVLESDMQKRWLTGHRVGYSNRFDNQRTDQVLSGDERRRAQVSLGRERLGKDIGAELKKIKLEDDALGAKKKVGKPLSKEDAEHRKALKARAASLNQATKMLKQWDKKGAMTGDKAHEYQEVLSELVRHGLDKISIDTKLNEAGLKLEEAYRKIAKAMMEDEAFVGFGESLKKLIPAADNFMNDMQILKDLKKPSGPNSAVTENMIGLQHAAASTMQTYGMKGGAQFELGQHDRRTLLKEGGPDEKDMEKREALVKNLATAGQKFKESVFKSSIFFRNNLTDLIEKEKAAKESLTKIQSQQFQDRTQGIVDSFEKGPINFDDIFADLNRLSDLFHNIHSGRTPIDDPVSRDEIARLINEIKTSDNFQRMDAQTDTPLLREWLLKRFEGGSFAEGEDASTVIQRILTYMRSFAEGGGTTAQGKAGEKWFEEQRGDSGADKERADVDKHMEDLATQIRDTKTVIEAFEEQFELDEDAKKINLRVGELSKKLGEAISGLDIFGDPVEAGDTTLFKNMADMNKSVGDMVIDSSKYAVASAKNFTIFKELMDKLWDEMAKLKGQMGVNNNQAPPNKDGAPPAENSQEVLLKAANLMLRTAQQQLIDQGIIKQ